MLYALGYLREVYKNLCNNDDDNNPADCAFKPARVEDLFWFWLSAALYVIGCFMGLVWIYFFISWVQCAFFGLIYFIDPKLCMIIVLHTFSVIYWKKNLLHRSRASSLLSEGKGTGIKCRSTKDYFYYNGDGSESVLILLCDVINMLEIKLKKDICRQREA